MPKLSVRIRSLSYHQILYQLNRIYQALSNCIIWSKIKRKLVIKCATCPNFSSFSPFLLFHLILVFTPFHFYYYLFNPEIPSFILPFQLSLPFPFSYPYLPYPTVLTVTTWLLFAFQFSFSCHSNPPILAFSSFHLSYIYLSLVLRVLWEPRTARARVLRAGASCATSRSPPKSWSVAVATTSRSSSVTSSKRRGTR